MKTFCSKLLGAAYGLTILTLSVLCAEKGLGEEILAAKACNYLLGSGIYDKWISFGGERGILGCPVSDEIDAPQSPEGTTGRISEFDGGDGAYIVWHRTGRFAGTAFVVQGCIYSLYKDHGATASWLGFPVSDEYDIPDGRRSDFEGGFVGWSAQTRECRASKY